jgi:hypothetical protein
MIGVVVAVALLVVLSKQPGGLGGLFGQQGALTTLEMPPPGQPVTTLPQSSAQKIDELTDNVLGRGAGVVGAGVCTYYGAGAVAPVCAKVASLAEKPARQLANYTTVLATNYGGKALTFQANVANKATTAVGTFAAEKVDSAVNKAYDLSGRLPGPFGAVTKASVYPLKVTADLGAKGADLAAKGGTALVNGVKKGTEALSNTVNKVIHFGGLIGSSKLGRGSNGKDVFPNDMQRCQAMGIGDVETCSQQYSLQTRRWSWQ